MIAFLMICALLLIFPFNTTLQPALCTYFCSHCLGTHSQSLGQGARTFKTRRHIVSPPTASQRAHFAIWWQHWNP